MTSPPFYDPISNLSLSDTFYTWYRRTNDIVQKLNPLEIYSIAASTNPGMDGLEINVAPDSGIATIGYALPYDVVGDHDFEGGLTFSGTLLAIAGASFDCDVTFRPNDDSGVVEFVTGNVKFADTVNKVEFFTPEVLFKNSNINIRNTETSIMDSYVDSTGSSFSLYISADEEVRLAGYAPQGGDGTVSSGLFRCGIATSFINDVLIRGQDEDDPFNFGGKENPSFIIRDEVATNIFSDSTIIRGIDANGRYLEFDSNNITTFKNPNYGHVKFEDLVKFGGKVEFLDQSEVIFISGATTTFEGTVDFANTSRIDGTVSFADTSVTTFEDNSQLNLEGTVYDSENENLGGGYVLITDPSGKLKYGDKQYIWNTNEPNISYPRSGMRYEIANMSFLAGKVANGDYNQADVLPLPRYYVFSRRSLLPSTWDSSTYHGATHGGITFHPGYYSIIRASGASGDMTTGITSADGLTAPNRFGGTFSHEHARIYACGGYKTFGLPYPEMGATWNGLTGCDDERMSNKYWWADINIYDDHNDPLLAETGSGINWSGKHYTYVGGKKKFWTSNMRIVPSLYTNYDNETASRSWSTISSGDKYENGVPIVPGIKWAAGLDEAHTSYWGNMYSRNQMSSTTTESPEIVFEDPVDLIGAEQIGMYGDHISKNDTLKISSTPYMWNVTFDYEIPAGMRLIFGVQVQPYNQMNWRDAAWDSYPYHLGGNTAAFTANDGAGNLIYKDPGYDIDAQPRRVIQVPSQLRTRAETFGCDETHEIQRMLRIKGSDWIKNLWRFAYKMCTDPDSGWEYRQEWLNTTMGHTNADATTLGGLLNEQDDVGIPSMWITKDNYSGTEGIPVQHMNTIDYANWNAKKQMSIMTDGMSHGRQWIEDNFSWGIKYAYIKNLTVSYYPDGHNEPEVERAATIWDQFDWLNGVTTNNQYTTPEPAQTVIDIHGHGVTAAVNSITIPGWHREVGPGDGEYWNTNTSEYVKEFFRYDWTTHIYPKWDDPHMQMEEWNRIWSLITSPYIYPLNQNDIGWDYSDWGIASGSTFHYNTYGVTGCGRDDGGWLYGSRFSPEHYGFTEGGDNEYVASGVEYSWWGGATSQLETNESRLYVYGPYAPGLSDQHTGPDIQYYDRVLRPQLIREFHNGGKRPAELESMFSAPGFRKRNAGVGHNTLAGWGAAFRVEWKPENIYVGFDNQGAVFSTSFRDPRTTGFTSGAWNTRNWPKDNAENPIIEADRCMFWADNREMIPWWISNSRSKFDYFGQLPAVTGDIYGTHTMGGANENNANKHKTHLRAFFNDDNNPMFSPFKEDADTDKFVRWTAFGGQNGKHVPEYEREGLWGSGFVYHSPSISDQMIDQYPDSALSGGYTYEGNWQVVEEAQDYDSGFVLEDWKGNRYLVDGFHRGSVSTFDKHPLESRSRYTTIDLDFTHIEPEVYWTPALGSNDSTYPNVYKQNTQKGSFVVQIPAPVGALPDEFDEHDVASHILYMKTKILSMDIHPDWKSTPREIWSDTINKQFVDRGYYTGGGAWQENPIEVALHDYEGDQQTSLSITADGEPRNGNVGNTHDHEIYAAEGRQSISLTPTSITIQR